MLSLMFGISSACPRISFNATSSPCSSSSGWNWKCAVGENRNLARDQNCCATRYMRYSPGLISTVVRQCDSLNSSRNNRSFIFADMSWRSLSSSIVQIRVQVNNPFPQIPSKLYRIHNAEGWSCRYWNYLRNQWDSDRFCKSSWVIIADDIVLAVVVDEAWSRLLSRIADQKHLVMSCFSLVLKCSCQRTW